MKASELTHEQCEILASKARNWMAINRTTWMRENRPELLEDCSAYWSIVQRSTEPDNEVPARTLRLLEQV